MKEALYWKKKENSTVQCFLCPRQCIIKEGNVGFCRVRKNIKGKLQSLIYGKVSSAVVDPIEKKPLFHFLPGSKAYSIGTVGCNLRCLHCQNWEISQADINCGFLREMSPEEIVDAAIKENCRSISYTYNDPIIFYEYALDTAKLAKKKGLKNTIVSNGFINREPLKEWIKYIDAANIDLKGFTDKFYKEITTAWLEPVLETLKFLKDKIWLEVTNLIIPGQNDNMDDIKKMCEWIKNNLGTDVPLHFSRFWPYYKMQDVPPTREETLTKARDIALRTGLNYVYIGNISIENTENTFCPKCKKLLIERKGFTVTNNNMENSKCSCGEKIAGVWE